MPEPAPTVFISYAREDAPSARRVAEALRAAGMEVWFDLNELRGGDAWDARIRRQIKECSLFLPIISAQTESRNEGYFRLEWSLAEERTRLMAAGVPFVVPVVIDATGEGDASVPDQFLRVQWTRLPGGEVTVEFVTQLARLMAARAQRPARTATPFPPNVRRRGVLGGVVALLLLAALGGTFWWGTHRKVAPGLQAGLKSIAVLAFKSIGDTRVDDYFSDGISEEVLNELMKAPGLRVAARTSAFSFKGRDVPMQEIGRALGVAYVVEGSILRTGSLLRVRARLFQTADGLSIWSKEFPIGLDNLLVVQAAIAIEIAGQLQATLQPAAGGPAINPDAYQLVLKARHAGRRENNDGWKESVENYRAAIALAPDYALAWAEMGRAYSLLGRYGGLPVGPAFQEARVAADRALRLDANLPQAHALLGMVQRTVDWDWKGAEASYRRALALAPGNAEIMRDTGVLFANIGRLDEAVALGRESVERDPLNPAGHYFQAVFLWYAQRHAEAAPCMMRAIELAPQGVEYHSLLARIQVALGQLEAAAANAEREPNEAYKLVARAYIAYARGDRAAGDAIVREITEKHGRENAYFLAGVYATAGEADLAFQWLERAREVRATGLAWIRHSPAFLKLHADPRWPAFVRTIGLEPESSGLRPPATASRG